MKKFLGYAFIIFCPLILYLSTINNYVPKLLDDNSARDVYELVENSNKAIKTDLLLLGDSVCDQIFRSTNIDSLIEMCDNQAYEVPGCYMLLNNLLKQKSEIKKVVLMINPFSLSCNLNQDFTYNYLVKPFYRLLPMLDEEEQKYIETTFPMNDFLYKIPFFRYSLSEFDLKNSKNHVDIDEIKISKINFKYLNKIDSLCNAFNIDFKLISPPLVNSKKQVVKNFKSTIDYENHNFFIKKYFDNLFFYDDSLSSDGFHLDDVNSFLIVNQKMLKNLIK